MKPFFIALFSLSIGLSSILKAEEKPLTAFETLKEAQKLLGDRGKNVLSMETENGKLRPKTWWIRFYDDSLFFKIRSVQMIGSEMVKNIAPANPFDGGNSKMVINPDDLKYDSEKCISFMEKVAQISEIPLYSLDIRLGKPHEGETNPIWHFEWFDDKGNKLGSVDVSAATGKITEVVNLRLKTKNIDSVARKSMVKGVKDTFLGVGADLEEFFTGKRTIDKDN